MGKTSSEVKERYNKKSYEDIRLRVPKGQKEKIKLHAQNNGMSINGYINKLINDDIKKP